MLRRIMSRSTRRPHGNRKKEKLIELFVLKFSLEKFFSNMLLMSRFANRARRWRTMQQPNTAPYRSTPTLLVIKRVASLSTHSCTNAKQHRKSNGKRRREKICSGDEENRYLVQIFENGKVKHSRVGFSSAFSFSRRSCSRTHTDTHTNQLGIFSRVT